MNPPKRLRLEKEGYISLQKFDEKSEAFIESLGYQVLEDGANGWVKLGCHVEEHRDNFGRCFVYCGAGTGTLKAYYPGSTKVYVRHLSKGMTCVFNDCHPHEFILTSKSCTLLIANVKKKKKK